MKKELKEKALQRLKIICGQVRGLMKMVEDETYCPDILTQSLSVQESLRSFDAVMLENHLATHVVEQMQGNHRAQAVEELLAIFKLNKKR